MEKEKLIGLPSWSEVHQGPDILHPLLTFLFSCWFIFKGSSHQISLLLLKVQHSLLHRVFHNKLKMLKNIKLCAHLLLNINSISRVTYQEEEEEVVVEQEQEKEEQGQDEQELQEEREEKDHYFTLVMITSLV